MKILYALLLTLLASLHLSAQTYVVRFKNGSIVPTDNVAKRTFKQSSLKASLYNDQYFLLVQFSKLPSSQQQIDLTKAGVTLQTYISGNAYLANVRKDFNFLTAAQHGIRSLETVPVSVKIDPAIVKKNAVDSKDGEQYYAISLFSGIDKNIAQQELQKAGAVIVQTKLIGVVSIFIQCDTSLVTKIAALPFVSYVNLQHVKDKTLNNNNIGSHAIAGLQSTVGRNLDGRGVAVGVGDNSEISTHIDFTGRLINRVPATPEYHGTHTSGTVAGGGLIDSRYKGMAPKSLLISQYFSDVITNTPAYVTDYNLVATNNSYYSGDAGCPGEGEYDILSNYLDAQSRTYNQVLHVVASGNDGLYTCNPYPNTYATVKSGWQCAKNNIVVGNLNGADYSLGYGSSKGPVNDGRIKPEIIANGTNTYSTYINNIYGPYSGTSMAAPVVTGSLALLQQRYRQLHGGANGNSALMKALLCNTAEDLGNRGPDYTYGFGMLNALRAVESMEANRYTLGSVSNSGLATQNITIPAGAARLKVMLTWIDKEAAANAAVSLVNDLDLTVTDAGAVVHRPLVLSAAPDSVTALAIERRDSLNNIEQVVIDNPATGSYTLSVKGFAVPFGPQAYALTYQVEMPNVTVQYPYGGETAVPGEIQNIRWSVAGNQTDSVIIDYSANGATSWTALDTTTAMSRTIPWVVPNAATNNALIRVRRQYSGLADTSTYPFTVLGQPSLVVYMACPGYARLSWTTIPGATSYDVYQLVADSMKVIGNTTDTFFMVSGLSKNKPEWLAVAARNGSVAGRRSLASSVLADNGPCTLTTFDNDMIVESILEPTTARSHFSDSGEAIKNVKVRIKNLGAAAAVAPYSVSYSYNGGPVTTQTVNITLTSGSTTDYTFTSGFPVIAAGFNYNFKAWVTKSGDTHHNNDTAYKTVKLLNNDTVHLPYTQNFEGFADKEYLGYEKGLSGSGAERFDFISNSSRGRGRSFVNTGIAYSGTKAFTLDQRPFSPTPNADSLLLTLNGAAWKQSRLEFFYKNHGQENLSGNKVCLRANENSAWIEAFDLYANQGGINEWKKAKININNVLAPDTAGSTFQIKFGQEGYTSTNSAVQELDVDDGYSFDDIGVYAAENDISLEAVVSPKNGCGLSNATPVTLSIKNYAPTTLTNIQVSYKVNGGATVTELIPSIAANATLQYSFSTAADFSALIDYNCDFWISYAADTYKGNDSIIGYSFHNSPVISSFPYLQGFETDSGYWYSQGSNNSWKYGTPAKTIINKAANGTKAWVTGLTGNYKNNEVSYLYSPCFDISSLTQPVLSFSHIFQIETDYDFHWVEYSVNGGSSWQKLGAAGSGTNWYDDASRQKFRLSKTSWHVASIDIPPTMGNIRFRFVLAADAGVALEGVGIDDIHIFDKKTIYDGVPITSGLTQTVNANGWVHFDDVNGKRVASINSFGQNLGVTNVKVFTYVGSPRSSNNRYYADRNIVIQPATEPTSNVAVRFYFTNTEGNNIVSANNCFNCSTVHDPYELGVTRYSGSAVDENGDLDDDSADFFDFIMPSSTEIIPYNNGYYAEFTTNHFSEFWLSKGIINAGSNCPGNMVQYRAESGASTYQWQENKGNGFVNLMNNGYVTGVNTPCLQLNNVPTSASGFKYRCIINGVADAPRTLSFKMVWNGSVDDNWMAPANWSCNALPDQYTDVIIPGILPHYPVLSANAAVKSIKVHPGVFVKINPGVTLEIKGN